MNNTARLLITCPDRPGIVSAVTTFLYSHNANINDLDQHSTDPEGGTFFMRLEFQTPHLNVSKESLEESFGNVVADRFDMDWQISYASEPKRTAVLVSKHDHALLEILWRVQRGDLKCNLTQVISNHSDLEAEVTAFGIPFHHVPVDKDNREASEDAILKLLGDDTDLVILARYMQILTARFISPFPNRIINIHHSFLPAFVGANPYARAYDKGVKLIGATAHYVTEELDEGPIIEQDVARVTHRRNVDNLKNLGSDLERTVLARAVKWHLEDRILVHGNKTVVFT
ncbi:formyltetrahydrofolate deformylase [Desulfovibrio inopinatus]|uniref:formyltetrahydrofolate deformylase n=1 Tax=Desulfovibrio inopinatus TaxID=102109 RepID=UPI0003F54785|nr:formyltetrahydrofolate deformylase [Desulfovibrio inopinatus]